MLIEELFSKGVMTMGASRVDPSRQVGVFRPEATAGLAAAREAEMAKFRWIAGEWDWANRVPATRANPAYEDIGEGRYSLCEAGTWICRLGPDGKETPQITYDFFGRQWIYVLTRGGYGILRSREGWEGNRIVFTGRMLMLGIDCEWRMTWVKASDDRFHFVNQELLSDGTWAYIDEWHFTRK